MNPNERRRIAWGPDPDSRLDPFVIDRQGRVFNAEKDERKDAMVQVHAARIWNKTGRGLWYAVDNTAPGGRGPRRPHLQARELIRTRPDGTEVTQWLYRRKAASLPKTVTPRPISLRIARFISIGLLEMMSAARSKLNPIWVKSTRRLET